MLLSAEGGTVKGTAGWGPGWGSLALSKITFWDGVFLVNAGLELGDLFLQDIFRRRLAQVSFQLM